MHTVDIYGEVLHEHIEDTDSSPVDVTFKQITIPFGASVWGS